jgi:hypothetical protein
MGNLLTGVKRFDQLLIWTHGGKCDPHRTKPRLYSSKRAGQPVLFSAVWALSGVTTVVWTIQSSRERCKFRLLEEMEASWTVQTLKISHATLGGVTDQVQEFKVATQNGEAPIEWIRQLGLDASLDQILDCKVLGNTAAEPKPGHPSGGKEHLQVKQASLQLSY